MHCIAMLWMMSTQPVLFTSNLRESLLHWHSHLFALCSKLNCFLVDIHSFGLFRGGSVRFMVRLRLDRRLFPYELNHLMRGWVGLDLKHCSEPSIQSTESANKWMPKIFQLWHMTLPKCFMTPPKSWRKEEENTALDLGLDLEDCSGERASVERPQLKLLKQRPTLHFD